MNSLQGHSTLLSQEPMVQSDHGYKLITTAKRSDVILFRSVISFYCHWPYQRRRDLYVAYTAYTRELKWTEKADWPASLTHSHHSCSRTLPPFTTSILSPMIAPAPAGYRPKNQPRISWNRHDFVMTVSLPTDGLLFTPQTCVKTVNKTANSVL